MIDLSKSVKGLYKIKLEDGTVLQLRKPTQAMLLTMMEMSQEGLEGLELMSHIYSLLARIFNRNTINRSFTQEELEEMLDLELAMEVMKDYLNSTLAALGK